VKNILVVDDKIENRYMIESLLKGDEFQLISANNGIEALELAHNNLPDLVISDILMPVMDGFTLCKEWRKDEVLKKIPFIFYTAAYTNPEDIKYALKLGADRFLIKPQEPEEFLTEIKQVLKEFESGELKPSADSDRNELQSLREYNSILFRKLEDKLFQIELDERKLKRYSHELDQNRFDLKILSEKLYKTYHLLEYFAEIYNIPYSLLNDQYIIQKFNHSFELSTNYKENQVIGNSIDFLFSDKNFLEKIKESVLDVTFEPLETFILKKDGSRKRAVWYCSLYKNDDNNNVVSALVLMDDTVEKKGVIKQDILMKENLENKIKDRTRELEYSREQLRGLSSHLQNIREDERKHVAMEIHDELGHLLTAMKLDMEGLMNQNDLSADSLREKLLPLINMVDASIDSVKTIATELRPAILDNFGLVPALEWLVQQLRIRTKIECEISVDTGNYSFNNDESTAIFRIFQEILTNVSRHSKATKIWISFKKDNNSLMLRVKDNGVGFDVEKVSKVHSFGILGMSERALSIGGKLTIESIKDIGTTVNLEIKERNNK
jgi:signal transduction histidine kinase/CheY-like chemotaxis protein